jgi:hypothetical protein
MISVVGCGTTVGDIGIEVGTASLCADEPFMMKTAAPTIITSTTRLSSILNHVGVGISTTTPGTTVDSEGVEDSVEVCA